MKARFLLDEQLSPALAERLVARGFEAQHVTQVGLAGGDDMRIWRYAARTGATLLTKDEDFADRARGGATGVSVVWIRLGNTTTASLWRALEPLLPEIVEALEKGERLIEVD